MRNKKLTTRRSKQLQRRRRNGSVMIMVVALLVLLALMGTAWIATVRNDRSASAANVANAENELLLEGVKNIAAAVVGVDAVHGKKVGGGPEFYRPHEEHDTASPPQLVYAYRDAVCPVPEKDGVYRPQDDHLQDFLASRVPLPDGTSAYWPAITAPLVPTPIDPVASRRTSRGLGEGFAQYVFESPVPANDDPAEQTQYRERLQVYPAFLNLTRNGRTESYPAFRIKGEDNKDRTFLAADTDGDGVADAGLWRLPVGEQNGITWYAAARIIDNNSAVNAAVAWNSISAASGTDNGYDFYPSNISLRSLLSTDAELNALNAFRFNGFDSAQMVQDNENDAGGTFSWSSEQEALWMLLGRRLENPWFLKKNGARARALGLADQMALARGFISRATNSKSTVEQLLSSLFIKRGPYTDVKAWFDDNFDYLNNAGNSRPLIVTRNAVSNHSMAARDPANPNQSYVPAEIAGAGATNRPVKTSLNTAPFADLWLGYWNVMIDRSHPTSGTDTTPFATGASPSTDPYVGMDFGGETHPWRMFRSSIRDTNKRFRPEEQLLLRSAIAAFNTTLLRTRFAVGTQEQKVTIGAMEVRLYGFRERQPFISEVYVNATKDPVDNDGDVVLDDRNENGYIAVEFCNPYDQDISLDGWKLVAVDRKTSPLTLKTIHTFAATDKVPLHKFLVVENVGDTKKDNGDGTFSYIPKAAATGRDKTYCVLVANLMQEVQGKELVLMRPAPGSDPAVNMAPADQFDFGKLAMPASGAKVLTWHYSRNSTAMGATTFQWEVVYPGRYDGDAALPHEGLEKREHDATASDPWNGKVSLTVANPASYTRKFPIRLEPLAGDPAKYPFGGFARVGDIMQVPFIGSYVVTGGGGILEMNSITMDSAFAEDTDTTAANDQYEQIGRFCPLPSNDLSANPSDWRYRWATRVFDYFTVQAPHDDFLPNAPAETAGKQAVANSRFNQLNDAEERLVGVEGLININTAPWKVLAALPLVPPNNTGKVDAAAQADLAQKIAAYRDANGPFKTVFDLYKVPEVQARFMTTDATKADGALSAGNGSSNGLVDFEDHYAWLTRISNLVTTRSDTFTAYLLIQGWRIEPGQPPELVVQRRTGVIIDRNRVRSGTADVKMHTFPVD